MHTIARVRKRTKIGHFYNSMVSNVKFPIKQAHKSGQRGHMHIFEVSLLGAQTRVVVALCIRRDCRQLLFL